MPKVYLVYFKDCPNIELARRRLLLAFSQARVEATNWEEWDCDDPSAPDLVRGYGSPTILVDGKDVAGALPAEGRPCCRVYQDGNSEFSGAPSVSQIVSALEDAVPTDRTSIPVTSNGWRTNAAMAPAIGMSLLPKVACPACWPAYAGFLTSVGLGFLTDTSYLLPLTGVFLVVAVGALAFRAKRRRGYWPFIIGSVSSAVVLIGKFNFDSEAAMYLGLAALVAASVWNSWPMAATRTVCTTCVEQ